jgi:SWI/SNF-related matrix-associated actin-dependent regulator 1 of chromatin subfamily A
MMGTQTAIDISSLLPWSEPREIPNLRRQVRSAPVTEAFWCLWRDRKTELKAAGISIGTWPKESKNFMASWWTPLGAGVEAEREASAELSRAAAPVGDFEPPCPEGLKYYPFQKAGIQFCVRKFSRGEGGVLIGDQPGLGKSCQAVGVMNCNPEIKRVLVFTKASLKNFWAREMKRWSVRKLEIGMASGQRWPATEIVIANYDIAAKWAKRMRMLDWDLVILDESQACKNPKAQRTKAIMGDKKAGLAPLRARYRLCCSGSPIENRPIELFTTLNFLDPARWRSYWGYAKRYCGMVSNGWGMDVSGASNLNELQIILRETGVLIRRLKAEVLRELPAKTRVVVELEGDEMGAALAQENAVSSRYAAELEQAQAGIELARALESDDAFKAAVKALAAAHNIPFTEMAKVRHQTALAKLPAAIEAIKEDLDEFSVKQVIFAHHSDVIAGLRSAFPGSVAITGETPAEDRQAIVDRFQSEPGCGPFFGSIRACGEGITLTAARLCSFIEIDWSPAKMEQASDRIHRIGQRDNVLIKHLVVRGSIDAWIIQTILAKQEIIEKALDTDPGEWATEPVLVARHEPIGKRKEIAEEALLMTTEQNLAIHAELKRLDEAGSGFSKVDAAIGRALAGLPVLTAKQAVLAKRLCLRQIGEIKL